MFTLRTWGTCKFPLRPMGYVKFHSKALGYVKFHSEITGARKVLKLQKRFTIDIMDAIPLCDNIKSYIYLRLDTTVSVISSYKVNWRVATCFGRSCSHHQASSKTEQVRRCAHNMGSHIVHTSRYLFCFWAGLMMAAWAAETCRHTSINFIVTYYWNGCV